MIQKKKLNQFYIEEYEKVARQKQKNPVRESGIRQRIQSLSRTLRTARPRSVNIRALEELHRQLKNVACYAYRKQKSELIEQINTEMIPQLAALDLGVLLEEQREGVNGEFLAWLGRTMPGAICRESLFTLYPKFREHKVKGRILELVPAKPEMEFAEVREIKRHFILHIGPTNSGKTFQALERLKNASNGVYLGPLRLLALEVYEQMGKYGVPCTMRTGQECIEEEGSRVTASTIEMADYDDNYDIAVIDEAQLVIDPERGHNWTKAILGLRASEIHICMSPPAERAVCHLIGLCNDDYEVKRYERKTELICEDKAFVFPDDVQEGDALIAFSKKSVLDIAGRLEDAGIASSVIYGSLPPEIRRRQTHLFNSGKTKVAVATDAIGMGLNLPVRRIVFMQVDKFDGTTRRGLKVSEVKQIAGRAGRFGIYDRGYVNAMGPWELEYIRERYQMEETPIEEVRLGFPQVLLDIDAPLDELMKIWYNVRPSRPFVKENIDEAMILYDLARKCRGKIDGFDNKRLLYKMITCPIDIKDKKVVSLWLDYCKSYSADVGLFHPRFRPQKQGGIMQYETYYKQLELYYQFSHRMQKVVDEEWLADEREKTEMQIMRYLSKGKTDYILRCRYCGRVLPPGSPYRVCDRCHGNRT